MTLGGAPEVRFYYGLGSRYSYLAATQLERLAADTGAVIIWCPLYSADLFAARGADPFHGPPVSGQYDWAWRRADAAAWADYYGVPFREPDDLRCDYRRLALACTAAARLGAGERFSRALFEAVFVTGTSPLDDSTLLRIATASGLAETRVRRGAGRAARPRRRRPPRSPRRSRPASSACRASSSAAACSGATTACRCYVTTCFRISASAGRAAPSRVRRRARPRAARAPRDWRSARARDRTRARGCRS